MQDHSAARKLLNPASTIRTAHALSKEASERYPNSDIADLSLALVQLAKKTEQKVHESTRPRYWLRAASLIAILAIAWLPIVLLNTVHTRWEFETVTDLLEAADAGVNIVILLVGTVWFFFNLENRAWRKKALRSITELREFIHVIDLKQLYHSSGMTDADSSLTRGGQKVDLDYLFVCGRMVGLLSNIAALYTRNESDEAVWRAVSEIESLANAVALRLTNKIEIMPLIIRGSSQQH